MEVGSTKSGPIGRAAILGLVLFLACASSTIGQDLVSAPAFSAAELEQIAAPIALYPDELLVQIMMAATYPLEIVQAARWQKDNAILQGDALASALESQSWDPSVKSLIAFPEVLTMLSQKLDWTQKLGDAVLSQQSEFMAAVQRLRQRADQAGHLQSNEQQRVIVEEKTIIIQPAQPTVVYVPTYNPTVVYGGWPYPSYPPYYYYPPGYVPGATAFSFAAGLAVGAAWGYAWGGCGWGHGHIDVDINRNFNYNRNINRNHYRSHYGGGGRGNWSHNPQHRRGVGYRDNRTAQRYGRSNRGARSREGYRGHSNSSHSGGNRGHSGRQNTGRPSASYSGSGRQNTGRPSAGYSGSGRPNTGRPSAGQSGSGRQNTGRPNAGQSGSGRQNTGRPNAGQSGSGRTNSERASTWAAGAGGSNRNRSAPGGKAFEGYGSRGSTKSASSRGQSSRGSQGGGSQGRASHGGGGSKGGRR